MLKSLASKGYGIYALLTSLVGYYGLLDLGLGQGVIKFVSEYSAKKDLQGIGKSINTALCVQILLGFCGSVILVLFATPLLHLLKVSPAFWNDALAGLYACTVGFFLTMISGTLSSALMGLQRYDLTSKVNIIMNIVLTAAITILALMGYRLKEVVYMTVFCSAITLCIFYFIVKNELPEWKLSTFAFERAFFRKMFNFSGYMFVSKVSGLFNNYIVRFIISAILGPAVLTFFVVPMKVITALGGFMNNIASVFFPFASELKAVDQRERLRNVYIKASKYIVTFAFPAYLLFFFFSKEILKMWMGADFAEQGWKVMGILSAAYFLSAFTMVPANITFGLGHSRVIAFFSTLVLFLGIAFVAPLAIHFGIIGAAFGILISQFVVPFFILYVTKKIIKYPVADFLRGVISYHIAALAASLIVFYLFNIFMHNSSILVLLLFFAFFIIIYYFSCILLKWVPISDVKKMLIGSKERVNDVF